MNRPVTLSAQFAALLVGSIGLLGLLYGVEVRAIAAGLPEGLLVGIVQCAAELLGAFALLCGWKSIPKEDRKAVLFLSVGLLAFAVADFFWVYLFYYLKMGRKTLPAIFLTHLPYGVGYIGVASALFLRLRKSVPPAAIRLGLLAALVFTVPFYLRFIFFPAVDAVVVDRLFAFFSAHLFNTLGCFVLVNAAILTIAFTRDLRWSMIGIGGACLVMENWAFRAEMLTLGPPSYGFYDYFWAFGILTCVYPLAYGRGSRNDVIGREPYDPRSVRTRTRLWIIGPSLLFLSLLAGFASPNSVIVRFLAVGTALTLLLAVFLGQLLAEQIEELATRLSLKVTGDLGIAEAAPALPELPSELKQVYETVFREKIEEKRLLQGAQEELGQQAARVAHDIRSPLAALGVVMEDLSALSEQKRLLVRAAVARINDIANQLLQMSKQQRSSAGTPRPTAAHREGSAHLETELLWPIVDELATEKRLEHKGRSGLQLDVEIGPGTWDGFSRIDRTALRAALSNLLNNAIQAVQEGGRVVVSLHEGKEPGRVEIEIRDSGPGFPDEVLRNLGRDWNTHGKEDGTGLGLSSSIKTVQALGGEIVVHNQESRGAVVTMRLSRVSPPDWFCREINVGRDCQIFVLDDDEPIHRVWDTRFHGVIPSSHVHHFSSAMELARVVSSPLLAPSALYLVDYELLNGGDSGIDVIRALRIQKNAILVTSRYEDHSVRGAAAQLGVTILPKPNVAHVPIRHSAGADEGRFESSAKSNVRAILLHSDLETGMKWKRIAKYEGVDLLCLQGHSTIDLLLSLAGTARAIIVDDRLDGEGKAAVSFTLSQRTGAKIYLCGDSGLAADKPWLAGLVSSPPNWGEIYASLN